VERIGRGEYRWKMGVRRWQLSAEAAFNALDTASDSAACSRRFDRADPLPEQRRPRRGGAIRGHPQLRAAAVGQAQLQLRGGAEYSQLSQAGAGGITREFIRPKGQFTAAWTPNPNTTVNLRLQRRVGQISFFNFVDSVNLKDENGNQGNVNLVPPQSWEAEVETVRRLGAWGSTTLRLYYHAVEDVIDIIPSARRVRASATSTARFGPASIRAARSISTRSACPAPAWTCASSSSTPSLRTRSPGKHAPSATPRSGQPK
jgi:hypothetical protein